MNVYIRTPFSLTKNLGKAYNEEMAMIPDGDAACFIDGDCCFLTPDYGNIINEYANLYPNAVLTCFTNRIHELARGQQHQFKSNDIGECIQVAMLIRHGERKATRLNGPVSGFLMVVPKSIWVKHKFDESLKCLGVDNDFTNKIRAAGIPVLRCDDLLVWHSYRLLDGSKSHLL